MPALVLCVGLTSFPAAPLRAQTAVADSAEFAAWRQVQKEDIDALRKKFMALAKAVPADKLAWRPMEGTRSFRRSSPMSRQREYRDRDVRPALAGRVAGRFRRRGGAAQETPDDQLIAAMDRAMQSLSATLGGLSRAKINTPITYYGSSTLPARRRPIPSTTCTNIWASWWRMPG